MSWVDFATSLIKYPWLTRHVPSVFQAPGRAEIVGEPNGFAGAIRIVYEKAFGNCPSMQRKFPSANQLFG